MDGYYFYLPLLIILLVLSGLYYTAPQLLPVFLLIKVCSWRQIVSTSKSGPLTSALCFTADAMQHPVHQRLRLNFTCAWNINTPPSLGQLLTHRPEGATTFRVTELWSQLLRCWSPHKAVRIQMLISQLADTLKQCKEQYYRLVSSTNRLKQEFSETQWHVKCCTLHWLGSHVITKRLNYQVKKKMIGPLWIWQIFQNIFYAIFPGWMFGINPADLWNIPFNMSGY